MLLYFDPANHRDSGSGEEPFGHRLVHRERACKNSGAGVGNPEEFEHPLNCAVFAPLAM